MKKSISLFFALLCSFCINAQIQWQKSLGGTSWDIANSIIQTSDSGYVVAGSTYSNNGDVSGNHGLYDYWVVRLNGLGIIEWQKSLGGTGSDGAYSVIQAYDSGYVIAGTSESNNGDVTGNHGFADFWVVKLNSPGIIQWQKSLGGSDLDIATSIIQTYDSGYVIAGYSYSNDSDVTGNHGGKDYWVIKINSSGIIQWQKALGGTNHDEAYSIIQSSDSGFVVAGSSDSNDGDVTGNHGDEDCWIVKLNAAGTIVWQKSFGGTNSDVAYSIIQTYDGGYIFSGSTYSNNGDVTGNHGSPDYWVVKINSLGNLEWQKSLGGTDGDLGARIIQTSDSGYVVTGTSGSNDGDVTGNHGGGDYWVVKLTSSGILEWQQALGGTDLDAANSVAHTYDNKYVVSGRSNSNDFSIANHGGSDYWVVKLDLATGVENHFAANTLHVYPNPLTNIISIGANIEFENAQFYIFNTMGCIVYSGMIKQKANDINVEKIPSGIYYLRIIKGEKMWVEKIIKH